MVVLWILRMKFAENMWRLNGDPNRTLDRWVLDLRPRLKDPAVPFHSSLPNREVFFPSRTITEWCNPEILLRPVIMIRLHLSRGVIYEQPIVGLEETPTTPAVALGPKAEGRQVRWAADRGPGVERLFMVGGEVDELFSARRQVAAPLVDPTLEPLTVFKLVRPQVPLDQLHALGRPTPEDHGDGIHAGKDDEERGLGR